MKILTFLLILAIFTGCSEADFSSINNASQENLNCINCDAPRPPVVSKAGTVTILLALGDQLNNELIIKGTSSQLIAENAISFASPVVNPKILVVRDRNHQDETAYDTQFIATELLKRHDAVYMEEPLGGLQAFDIEGYDVVWFNNPGHPMGSSVSRDALLNFSGGVILSGDDMSRGNGFDMSELTGLRHIDNGAYVECNGVSYKHDNNSGYKYSVSIDSYFVNASTVADLTFQYGNDIDNTVPADSAKIEVLAYAKGGANECGEYRPTIVRYEK